MMALLFAAVILAVGCSTDEAAPPSRSTTVAGISDPPAWLTTRAGGLTTTFENGERSFSLPARNLGLEERARFSAGNDIFEQVFTPADGLGPDFVATACASCHVDNGRIEGLLGSGPLEAAGPVVHVSRPGAGPGDPPFSLPGYGTVVQTSSVGAEPEATVTISWEDTEGEYPDGTPYSLRRPIIEIEGARGPIPAETEISLRIPVQLAGLGLLQAIDEDDLLALGDPDDRDGDGISGRLNRVPGADGSKTSGRFGWKAQEPDLIHQTAAALADDIGIATALRPVVADGTIGTEADAVELDARDLSDLAFYVEALAVPAGRDVEVPEVAAGAELFESIGCASCHIPAFTTSVVAVEGLSAQLITPFTDLLLHDLGPGLADGRPVFGASASEWRTSPLWGIGLLETVNGQLNLLHDGRARSIEEAVLWHGGEAQPTTDRFMALDAEDRRRLLRFVESR